MELHKAMLDNNVVSVIQYHGIEYRCERKEYCISPFRESGPLAVSLDTRGCRKVRPGVEKEKSEK